ncbi:MAG: hypothetical protein JSW66_00135 [Phycisphaerales bacterium]|nr:MAG: hypothetical protein JSW66_00135 [Phycisphaerales bacterium]
MESQSYLGIYIDKDTATAVCLDARGKDAGVLGCFSVSVADQEQPSVQTLAGLIAQGCAERQWKFSDVAVALDCALFMQHALHSEFTDPKQIAATVKFDTEEALATDVANVALAFEMTSSEHGGAELVVFTAERKVLSDILAALQLYNLDPVAIEPDVCCLSRFLSRKLTSPESQQSGTLFAMLSRHSGYLIIPPGSADEATRKAATVRTFLLGATQDRTNVLAREALITSAMVQETGPAASIRVFDSAGNVDCQQLGEKFGLEADAIDLYQAAGAGPQTPADCANPIDFAIAYGAALAHSEKGDRVDFRSDFNPFQGKKLKLHKTLKFAAVSVTILLIAAGLFFHTQLFSVNRDRSNLRSAFAKDYADVTLERLSNSVTTRKAVTDLEKLLRHVEAEKKGLIADKTSISSKLTLVLAAFNKCAAQTGLNIKSITITTKDIDITGDTSSRQNRQKIFDTIRSSGLEIVRERYILVEGRETFGITVAPKT